MCVFSFFLWEQAIEKGNLEGAKIYAQNAIRKKNESLNYLRLSSRLDAVASKVQTAVTMKNVTKAMDGVVKQMDKAMGSMNLEQANFLLPILFLSSFLSLFLSHHFSEWNY